MRMQRQCFRSARGSFLSEVLIVPSPEQQRAFAEIVVRTLRDAGFAALWAGGCVRDLLLGKTPKDYDVATDARPQQVRQLFGQRHTLSVGESFGVIVVLSPQRDSGQVEVATFRTDGDYSDGRRPDSVVFSTPEMDAQRRDFTINGMFYDPIEHKVLDYVGGERDLANGIVRAIGVPQARMTEDKLRMLRAVRFTATFDFQLDPETANSVQEMAEQLTTVSAERIGQETRRMLVDPHRHRAIELCKELRLLPVVFPELQPIADRPEQWALMRNMLRLLQAPSFPLAFAVLHDDVSDCGSDSADAILVTAEAGKRLRLSNDEIAAAVWLLKHRNSLRSASTQSLARLKRVLSEPGGRELLSLLRVQDLAHGREPADSLFCEEFLRQTPLEELNPPPLITGEDLKQLGLKPGPQFKQLLDALRDAQLNGEVRTFEESRALALQLKASR